MADDALGFALLRPADRLDIGEILKSAEGEFVIPIRE
jgi:DNA-binding IscR family transcriptional regulator